MLEFLGAVWEIWTLLRTAMGSFVIIYLINYALVFIRPEMGKKFGSKK